MNSVNFEQFQAKFAQPQALEETICYFAKQLSSIVREGESTLICFPREERGSFGAIAGEAVTRCGGTPVFWEGDLRWKTLLRLSFMSRATTIIASPLVVLGLSKLALHEGVPLSFFNVILIGYPFLDWMIDGIEQDMDCRSWGCMGPGIGSVFSGFSCQCGRGIHIRDDKFTLEIVDSEGKELPDGQSGRVVLSAVDEPELRFITKAYGSVMSHPCPCGNPAVKLVDIEMGDYWDASVMKVMEELLYWNSILDCRVNISECGMELEVVCFQGERLPKLPSCAKLEVRAWNPETDGPFSVYDRWVNP